MRPADANNRDDRKGWALAHGCRTIAPLLPDVWEPATRVARFIVGTTRGVPRAQKRSSILTGRESRAAAAEAAMKLIKHTPSGRLSLVSFSEFTRPPQFMPRVTQLPSVAWLMVLP